MASESLPQTVTAISLWEPWASLMRAGAKTAETRSWSTNYRGPLLVCAAKKKDPASLHLLFDPEFSRGIAPLIENGEGLHYGMAVALVDLIDIFRTDRRPARFEHRFTVAELAFGDYSPGRFVWLTDNLRTFRPFPVKGSQGLFHVELPEGLAIDSAEPGEGR